MMLAITMSVMTRSGAWNLIARARDDTSKILRRELGRIGIDVCEVVAGMLIRFPLSSHLFV